MPKKIAFSKAGLTELIERHAGERLVVYDTRQPSLIAELREGGTLSFYLYRWANGHPHRIRIGAFPEITVEQARDKVRGWISDQVDGVDIAALKRQRREEATLKDLFAHWLDYAKQHKKTWAEDERQFRKMLTGWHTRRLSTIKRSDVRAFHARIGKENGRYAANRVLALLRAMFNKAGDLDFKGENPAKGIKKFREQSRDRFLQPSELPKFFEALKAEPNDTLRDFFIVCLYTGARRANVQEMRWAEVQLDAAVWRIPATKSGEPVTVHLSAPALAVLKARHESAKSEWVFPGGRRNQDSHLSSPKKAWARLLARAGLTDLRLHDLRRTLGSFQAAAGASLSIIGKSLGHKTQAATAVYARLNLDPVRASVDAAVAAMVLAGNEGSESASTQEQPCEEMTGDEQNKYQIAASAAEGVRLATPIVADAIKQGVHEFAWASLVREKLPPEMPARAFRNDYWQRGEKPPEIPLDETIRRGAQILVDTVLAARNKAQRKSEA